MCGIAGYLTIELSRAVDVSVAQRMGDALVHRGPDAAGIWSDGSVALAHRRLSIIDLAGGDQPVGNEDGSVQVVFNGEIYNYLDLREELLAKGHRFRTQSDTEVLVHLYEECGAELVDRLRGMFAFALWDAKKRQLLLARDRVGQKPLYIYRDQKRLLFASELKAILSVSDVDRAINVEALEDYLTFGFIPGARSIFRHIEKLPPAHVLTVRPDALNVPARRYWTYPTIVPVTRSVADWCEAIEAKINEVVRLHLIADVPVGAFLSGGLDSSVVVATASAMVSQPLKTFAIGFGSVSDELPYAREVARQFNCQHHEDVVSADAAADLDDLVRYYDEPFADSSAIPTMRVSQLARQHVKVVLSGDGGDEAFGGYRRYVHDLREARLRQRLPAWFRTRVAGPLGRAWPKADWLPRVLRAKTLLSNLSMSAADAYANTMSLCRAPWRRRLLTSGVAEHLNGYRPELAVSEHFTSANQHDWLAQMIAADVNVVLPDDFLTKVDRASMSCGLEVRPPLVDHELLELTAQIPSNLKVRDGTGKWIFKATYRQSLPGAVCQRAKQGFEMPIDDWLRGPLRELFESLALNPHARVSAIIDPTAVRGLYRSHLRGMGNNGQVLWSILVLAKWCDRYLRPSDSFRSTAKTASGSPLLARQNQDCG
jgi:asparagine synthase (glutamine-hydrolysing)